MRIAVFSTQPYDRTYLDRLNAALPQPHELDYFKPQLNSETIKLAEGFAAICVFVNDQLSAQVLEILAQQGTRLIALRCAGFNNVDLAAAARHGITVVRVPAYSPYAVAEYAMGLILTLNRKIHLAYARVREGNFELAGLEGFDLHGRTLGIVGTGTIGAVFAKIATGFGCNLLGYDVKPNPTCEQLGVKYVSLPEIWKSADIISLHCPLTPDTRHLINAETIAQLKPGVMIVNTSRGAVIDSPAVIAGLKSHKIGSLALDVYEEESDYFFRDLSDQGIADDILARLISFPNVLVTSHQAFFTDDALTAIAQTTLANISEFEQTGSAKNRVVLR